MKFILLYTSKMAFDNTYQYINVLFTVRFDIKYISRKLVIEIGWTVGQLTLDSITSVNFYEI